MDRLTPDFIASSVMSTQLTDKQIQYTLNKGKTTGCFMLSGWLD